LRERGVGKDERLLVHVGEKMKYLSSEMFISLIKILLTQL
jgi:hypothetical protein